MCLPEEVRQSENPDHEPVRLFPPDRDGTSLHVVTPGAKVGRSGETLVVTPPDGAPPSKHAIRETDSLLLHGYAQATTQALDLCVEHGVVVHRLTSSGRHVFSLTATAGQVQRRVRQYRALADEDNCLRLAKALARAKIEGQHRYLLRGSRGDEQARDTMLPDLVPLRSALAQLDGAADRDSLRGFEGSAAVGYFRGLAKLIVPAVPDSLRYTTRSRRPPGPLQRAARLWLRPAAHERDAGDPGRRPGAANRVFHTPRARPSLVLDLMGRLFRVRSGTWFRSAR